MTSEVAFTEQGRPEFPAYINVRHVVAGTCTPEAFVVTVRERGHGGTQHAHVTMDRAAFMAFVLGLVAMVGGPKS